MEHRIEVLKESDLDAYVEIMAKAYPGLKIISDQDRQNMRDRLASTFGDSSTTIYGLTHGGRLVAGMILYDFQMNVRGTMLLAGGLGSLAVDMLHRKHKVAKAMVTYYLTHFRQRGAPLALLYPFRTDFYRRMGFGYGTKMNRYVFKPERLRVRERGRQHLEYLDGEDAERVLNCFDRYAFSTHGMIPGSGERVKRVLSNPAMRTVGYVEQSQILGFINFEFESQGHFLKNDLHVRQLIYQESTVLTELLAFLQSLSDQFEWIVLDTQDSDFHHLLSNPSSRADALIPSVYHESNTQGVGLMYRIIDLGLLFDESTGIRFGDQPITLRIDLNDSFMSDNGRDWLISFEDGQAQLLESGHADATLRIDVSDFSSVIMGAISLEQLVAYGLAELSDHRLVKQASDLFATAAEPVCLTAF
ncbi:MAG: GNAT family N-acetyltransferase [Chloroflexota bacterium]